MNRKNYFDKNSYIYSVDESGMYGEFGGQFVPEVIKKDLDEIYRKFKELQKDESFLNDLYSLLVDYSGRKTPLYFAKRLTKYYGKAKIYLKTCINNLIFINNLMGFMFYNIFHKN